jgi:hypothetical protein
MSEQKVLSASEQKKEDWMNSKWRPMMGWMYMLVCTADFVIFPVLWSLIQAVGGGQVHTQWQPITLQGAGLFHIAMGAVLGIAAFGRTQEKLGGANNGGIAPPTPSFGSVPLGGNTMSTTPSFGTHATPAPVSTGMFSSPVTSTPVTGGFGGTAVPATSKFGKVVPQQDDPVL